MKIELVQIRSSIGATKKQKDNLQSLRLGKIGQISMFNNNNKAFLGRLSIVAHFLQTKVIDE